MPSIHPLTFVQTFSGRLKGLQDRLDRLDDLLPHGAMSQEACREYGALQKRLLDFIMDTRQVSELVIEAVESRYPDCVERSRALSVLAEKAHRQERRLEACPHRCWWVRVVQVEEGAEVSTCEMAPKCLGEELSRRYPGHFRIDPFPQPEPEGPGLPGFGAP